jgi:hypothetical protein
VKGAFEGVLPDDRGTGVASVYAEFPRRQERLKLDRVLSADEYATMLAAIDSWASQDRVWAEVTSAFGAPSVLFGSTDPYYGKTLGYVTADPPPRPCCCFPLERHRPGPRAFLATEPRAATAPGGPPW